MDDTTKWYNSKYNCYGNLIYEVRESINKGDLVSYYQKRYDAILQGVWDGEKVCFKDKDDTVVRTTEWLKFVKKKDVIRLENQIATCNSKLSDKSFIDKAPANVISKEQAKLKDFTAQLEILKNQTKSADYYEDEKCEFMVRDTKFWIFVPQTERKKEFLISKLGSIEKINWHIQYLREQKTNLEIYSEEWYNFIYDEEITSKEIGELFEIFRKFI